MSAIPQSVGELYTQAANQDHLAHCASCRTRHAQADADATANAASIARRDRRQLGLRFATCKEGV